MQPLRQTKYLARLALAWFVLSIGVAVASPLIQSHDYIMVCSSSGMYQLMLDGDDVNDQGTTSHAKPVLKCPLCMLLDAPPNLLDQALKPGSLPHVALSLQATAAHSVSATCSAPLPARGPPVNHT